MHIYPKQIIVQTLIKINEKNRFFSSLNNKKL